MRRFFLGIWNFIKRWGIYGILGVMTLHSPIIISYFLHNDTFTSFAIWWSALWASPITPGWLLMLLLATFWKWFFNVVILGLVKWSKETLRKIQIQNQLGLYYSSEEIQMFLDMGKKIKGFSDKERKEFNSILREKRMKMIDEQWTKESESKID